LFLRLCYYGVIQTGMTLPIFGIAWRKNGEIMEIGRAGDKKPVFLLK